MVEGVFQIDLVKDIDLEISTPEAHQKLIKELASLNDIDEEKYLKGYALDVSLDFSNRFYMGDIQPIVSRENKSTGSRFGYTFKYDPEVSKKKSNTLKKDLDWLIEVSYIPKDIAEQMKTFSKYFDENFKNNSDIQQSWQDIKNQWMTTIKPLIQKKCENADTKNNYEYFKREKASLAIKNEKEGLRVSA